MPQATLEARSRVSRFARALSAKFVEFLTPRRIWSYPLVGFVVLALVAAYDRFSGHGLLNGISGSLGGDFLSFYTGGSFVRSGHAAELTNPEAQLAFQRRLLGANVNEVSVWVSPPYFAWLFVPCSFLPYTLAFVAVVGVSSLALFFAFKALARDLALDSSPAKLCWIALQYYPTIEWLLNGQMTALWLTVYVWVFLLLRRGHDAAAGAVLGCLACKPQLALGLGVALLAARRWRALLGALGVATALLALGFLSLPAAMSAYLHHGSALVSLVRDAGYHTAGLHGSFEFATLLLDGAAPRLAFVAGLLAVLSLLGAIALLWLRSPWQPKTRGWDLYMAATFALGTIASPHLYNYDLMLLMLPLFIVAARFETVRGVPLDQGPLLALTALIWALGLVGPTLAIVQQEITTRLFGFSAALQLGVVAVVLWAFATWKAARAGGCASAALR